jgi:nucleotide-binding universal stress UspA family protein
MATPTGRIVVGYDGSTTAEKAVDWAAVEASRRRLPLTVVYAVHPSEYLVGRRGKMPLVSERLARAGETVTGDGVEKARKAAPNVEVSGVTARGLPAATLVDMSEGATLLVLGTRGRGQLAGVFAGSVALPVTSHARCPVVVVHSADTQEPPGPGHPVVVGVDGSDDAEAALRWAVDLAAAQGAPLITVTAWRSIVSDPWFGVTRDDRDDAVDLDKAVRETAERTAADAADLARQLAPGLDVSSHATSGAPADVLRGAAGTASLLVVGSRGHGGFAGLLLGSVSHQVVNLAPCPVAVIRRS